MVALLRKTPPLPVALGVLFLLSLLIGGAIGGGGSGPGSAGDGSNATSRESLCSAYSALQRKMSDPMNIATDGDEIGNLADAAKSYPDASIRADGERLADLDGYLATNVTVRARMTYIAAECG